MSSGPAPIPKHDASPGWFSMPAMRYPTEYVWFLFLSSLDIMLTWAIIEKRGGSEVNPLAALIIEEWKLGGAIAFKFSLMLIVVIVCEVIGRKRDALGRTVARIAVVVSAMPVAYSLGLLLIHTFAPRSG